MMKNNKSMVFMAAALVLIGGILINAASHRAAKQAATQASTASQMQAAQERMEFKNMTAEDYKTWRSQFLAKTGKPPRTEAELLEFKAAQEASQAAFDARAAQGDKAWQDYQDQLAVTRDAVGKVGAAQEALQAGSQKSPLPSQESLDRARQARQQ